MPRPSRGDILGGVSAALVYLPIDLNYGLLAVAPLGPEYAWVGMLAAVYTTILGGLAATLAGIRPGQLFGTRPALALIVAALIAGLMEDPLFQVGDAVGLARIAFMVSACLAIAALLQLLFAALRLGRTIKYIPYPVLAGFSNGVALLMVVVSLRPILGLPRQIPWHDFPAIAAALQPLTLLVAVVTFAACQLARRYTRQLPPVLAGLVGGVVFYHLLGAIAGPAQLGPTVGAIPVRLPDLGGGVAAVASFGPSLIPHLAELLPYALALALLSALEFLLCAATLDSLTHTRHDSDRELFALGTGNLAAALAGGLPGSGSIGRSSTLLAASGRTRWANGAYIVTVAGMLLFAAPWGAYLPTAVVAAILCFIAWTMVDGWSRRLFRQLLQERRQLGQMERLRLWENATVMGLVALFAVFGAIWCGRFSSAWRWLSCSSCAATPVPSFAVSMTGRSVTP